MQKLTIDSINKALVMSVFSAERAGKTRLGLTQPGPIEVHNFDKPPDKSWEEHIREKDIREQRYDLYKITFAEFMMEYDKRLKKLYLEDRERFCQEIERIRTSEKPPEVYAYRRHLQSRNDIVLKRFMDGIRESCNNDCKSILIDGAAILWNVICLATYGKTGKIVKTDYGELRDATINLVNLLYASGKNVVISSEEKTKYVNNKPTDEMVNAGDSKLHYRVKTYLHLWVDENEKTDKKFKCTIKRCAENINIWGLELSGNEISYDIVHELINEG